MERANRTYREEFYNCSEATPTVAGFRADLLNWEHTYNHIRPHRALGHLTPAQFLETFHTTSTQEICHGRLEPVQALATFTASCNDGCMQGEIYREIAGALERQEPIVLATVARTRGSTPRKTGAKMVVRRDGSFFGTIGGGCGEAEVWQEAMDAFEDGKARIVTVDLTQPTDGDDKICGGMMDVFVERLG